MLLNKENIEDIQVVLTGTEKEISLREQGKTLDDNGWHISDKGIASVGKIINGDFEYFKDHTSLIDCLDEIKDKDLVAFYEQFNEATLVFKDWTHLAKYLGINRMVTLGSKVPEVVARRFKYFVSRDRSDVSTKLRELVLEYLRTEWKDKADTLIYEENI